MRQTIPFLLAFLCVSASIIFAQDDDVIRVNTDLVVLNLTVTDKDGHYVKALKKSDFKIYEDGVEVAPGMIASFSLHESPYAAVVLLDSSGSMEARRCSRSSRTGSRSAGPTSRRACVPTPICSSSG
jgi:hypothetical protein